MFDITGVLTVAPHMASCYNLPVLFILRCWRAVSQLGLCTVHQRFGAPDSANLGLGIFVYPELKSRNQSPTPSRLIEAAILHNRFGTANKSCAEETLKTKVTNAIAD